MSEGELCQGLLRASYDYEPQSEDEVAVKEDQLLFLLEKTDDDWWKVRVATGSQEDDGPSGLVPSAYVEPAKHASTVKALYDYEATSAGELSIKEDETLLVFEKEEEWILVQLQGEESKVGFVPANYVEESEGGEEPAPAPTSHIVIPDDPPKPAYQDPAERVAASRGAAAADPVQTWPVSEVDKKGKKKKGTLGVGNGAVFFASESDKTPVQKWQMADVQSCKVDKSKHVLIEVVGASAISLQFNAGSAGTASEILTKLESSLAIANPGASSAVDDEETDEVERPPLKARGASSSVHFATTPTIIPAREPSDTDSYVGSESEDVDGERASALYDFTADGEDELSVHAGESLVVLEKDGDEWWKCRNQHGAEGVVPASYVELAAGSGGQPTSSSAAAEDEEEEDDSEDREAEERAKAERLEQERKDKERAERAERERKKREADQRARADAAASEAERERKRKEKEKREKEKAAAAAEAEEREERERKEREEERRRQEYREKRASEKAARASEDRKKDSKKGPPADRVRTWHDRSGQFRVDAAFLGYADGKLRLHKTNGVIIEVPSEKMSPEDMEFVKKMTRKSQSSPSTSRKTSMDDDDEPLSARKEKVSAPPASKPARATPPQKSSGPKTDWFEFFLNAGCDVDDCSRYAQLFDRDKIDEAILPDITDGTMRTLGLREGDIIRVKKAISARTSVPKDHAGHSAQEDQLRRDEELARQLHKEVNGDVPKRSTTSPAPNLFAGPDGALKAQPRRGRPKPSNSVGPGTVELGALNTASDQIQRSNTPLVSSPISTTHTQPPPRSSSAAPVISGFDDDAWTNRPGSTKPAATAASPAPTQPARAPSAPPAPAPPPAPAVQPAPAPPPAPVAPAPAAAAPQATGSTLAKTDDDIFNQLARLSALRTQSPAVMTPPPVPAAPSPMQAPPPVSYQNGLGMGSSPVPMGQFQQAQATGMISPQPSNGPRGPFAPVPANQGLLQPLLPTTTGFNSFVPTRPVSNPSPFQPQQQMQQQQPSFLQTQPTGFIPNAFGQSNPLVSQPTGYHGGNFGAGPSPLMSQPTGISGPFQNPGGFGQVQSNPTGFNPGFGQFNSGITSPPPVPPLPTSFGPPKQDVSPANIFAQMKSGTFGDDSAPQDADKYNALRQNQPLTTQATGWGYQQNNGYQGGFGYR